MPSPGQLGSPSVASRMYLGSVVASALQVVYGGEHAVAGRRAVAVGRGVRRSWPTCSRRSWARPLTSMPAATAQPLSPGKVFMPHWIAFCVALIAGLTAAVTTVHLVPAVVGQAVLHRTRAIEHQHQHRGLRRRLEIEAPQVSPMPVSTTTPVPASGRGGCARRPYRRRPSRRRPCRDCPWRHRAALSRRRTAR